MRSIDVPAGVIDCDEVGSGPPVVLLHGLLMDHTVWDRVLPLLPEGFRYLRPVLPLGAHRRAMHPGTDLTLPGQVRIVADLLDALGLEEVTLVHSDWGGALFLTAHGLDHRLARQVILPCEAFDNFPPGLPGRMVALAVRLPAGLQLAARQLRVGWLRRLPPLPGQMARRPVPDELVRRWTEPVLGDPDVRRDLLAYARGPSTRRRWFATPRHCGASRARCWCCGRRTTGSCPRPTAADSRRCSGSGGHPLMTAARRR
jgi:pimeloyl-ACP methyl ester carboxylesterase